VLRRLSRRLWALLVRRDVVTTPSRQEMFADLLEIKRQTLPILIVYQGFRHLRQGGDVFVARHLVSLNVC